MSELLLAGFLVVSELGGDGGHVSRIQTLFSLSQLQARGRTSAYVTPHTSPSSTRKRSWASSTSTVSDARLQTGGQLTSPDYLTGGKHIQSFPLSVLSDTRLGIDAGYYLQSIYENPPGKEPLLSATGGLPSPSPNASKQTSGRSKSFESNPSSFFPASSRKSAGSTSNHT
jgi:hypothetical protein